jgi:hypothetical protein
MVDNVEQVNFLVQEDRRITVTYVANKLDISCGSAYYVICENFKYQKIYVRCILKQLTDEHNWACMGTCFPAMDCHRQCKSTPLSIYKQMSEHGVEAHITTQEIQKCAFCRQSDVDTVLGLRGPSLSTARTVDRLSVVHTVVLCLKRS